MLAVFIATHNGAPTLPRALDALIAVDSAVVWEHLPPNRTTLRWLLQRRLLIGMSGARDYATAAPAVRRDAQRLRWLATGIGWGVLGLLLFPTSRVRGTSPAWCWPRATSDASPSTAASPTAGTRTTRGAERAPVDGCGARRGTG